MVSMWKQNENTPRGQVGLLREMGMKDAEKYLSCYPHQLSGGQRQRVAIAIALACDPELIIADEPTTALDPRNQKQIISVLKRLAAERNKGILFITHDLRLARELATKIAVMRMEGLSRLLKLKRSLKIHSMSILKL